MVVNEPEIEEFLIMREMQVKNFNEMKVEHPGCELKRHTFEQQIFKIFNFGKKKESLFYFSIDWDDNIISYLSEKLSKYINVIFVLPDNLDDYPNLDNIKLKKISIGENDGKRSRNK